MDVFHFTFPELGDGLHEGEIIKWHVQVGDIVEEDQVILEVQNDKAVVEIPSPVRGKVLEIKVEEGKVVVIDDVLITFEVEGGNTEDTWKERTNEIANDRLEGPVTEPSEENLKVTSKEVVENRKEMIPNQKALATPSVRKFAREEGVDIAIISGTGRHGQITREDILNYKTGKGKAPTPPVTQEKEEIKQEKDKSKSITTETNEIREPIKGIRKVIANAMTKSVYTAPHVTTMDEVNVTELVKFRNNTKALAEEKGIKVTYLPFIVKALIAAVRKYPILNASIDEENQDIVYKNYYHVGIATDTEKGLIVPVLKDADRKSIFSIASEIKELSTKGREGKLTPNELKGSTISITNIGSYGGMFFTPVINYPEVAILGIGRIAKKPIIENDEIVPADIMTLCLSFDHRVIDGATAQQATNYVKQLLEKPQLLMMEV